MPILGMICISASSWNRVFSRYQSGSARSLPPNHTNVLILTWETVGKKKNTKKPKPTFWFCKPISKEKAAVHKKSWLSLSSIHSHCQCWRRTLLGRGGCCKKCCCLTWLLMKWLQHLDQVTQMKKWKLKGENTKRTNYPGMYVSVLLAFVGNFSFEGWGFQKSTCQFWLFF